MWKKTWCNTAEKFRTRPPMSGKNSDRETVTKFDGTPGVTFDVYEEGILNFAAGKTDDRGWSLADHLMESDDRHHTSILNAARALIAVYRRVNPVRTHAILMCDHTAYIVEKARTTASLGRAWGGLKRFVGVYIFGSIVDGVACADIDQ